MAGRGTDIAPRGHIRTAGRHPTRRHGGWSLGGDDDRRNGYQSTSQRSALQSALFAAFELCYGYAMAATLEDLEGRTAALERAQAENAESLRWTVAKLGRIQAVQDEHTLRLDRIETRLDKVEVRLDRVEERLDRVEKRLDRVEKRLDRVEERLESVDSKVDALPRAIAEMIAASEKRLMAAIGSR
jgi:chromosome segregation ATPase